MNFRFDHNNINVRDLEKSASFYREALGLTEIRRKEAPDKSFILAFLGDGKTTHKIELTWLRDRTESYNLGDNEFHLAFVVDDYAAAFARHKEMGCVCYENPAMGIYFIEDPDGYWLEIIPEKKWIEVGMQQRMMKFLCVFLLLLAPALLTAQEQAQAPQLQSTVSIMTQPSMNVFRRFSGEAQAMYDFYGKVLGLKQLTTFNLGGSTSVARFDVGSSQVKFSAVVPNRKYQHGAIQDGTGLRLLTFFFPSQAPVAERFSASGRPVPEFRPIAGSKRSSALVQDPDGQWVEIVVAPDESAATYDQVEIGLVVSDLAVSRKFYREFVGLDELPPVKDPVLNTTKYPYRHGSTIVSLRSVGKPLPADTGSGGIQYVVSSAQAVQDLAKARQVTIATPLSTLPGFGLKTVWLDDPDGITNYFAEVGQVRPKQQ